MSKFNLVVCGGTFDLFHSGHKAFIQDALNLSEKVLLGITEDGYVQNFKRGLGIEDFQSRKFAVEQFLNSIHASDRVKVVGISNPYEPYLETSTDYQAIIVTEQTKQVADEINGKREQNGIAKLELIISSMKKADDGNPISSTRIRNGEINRDGRLYVIQQWENVNLILPENLRSSLQKPWGKIINQIPHDIDGVKTVVVGDATAKMFNEKKVNQFLSIIDFLIKRERRFQNLSELGFNDQDCQKVINPHKQITAELFKAVQLAFKNKDKQIILIDGEDDLAVLPVLLVAPLGFNIFYGQPDEGLVQIIVTEEIKEKAYQLVLHFDKS
jgi:pantetheine-phosphate adenylyltransferase